jgi:hypothetical protein
MLQGAPVFLLDEDAQDTRRLGFYTTRWVQAATRSEAGLVASHLVLDHRDQWDEEFPGSTDQGEGGGRHPGLAARGHSVRYGPRIHFLFRRRALSDLVIDECGTGGAGDSLVYPRLQRRD